MPAYAAWEIVNVPAIHSARRICYPTVPSCPSGNQTLYQSTDGSIFRLDCNIDYIGNDSGLFRTESIQSCMDTCDQRGSTCPGVVYVPSYATNPACNPYSCLIKNAIPASAKRYQPFVCNSLIRLNTGSSLATGTDVACIANNGATYRTADGSHFQIVCGTDFQSPKLFTFNANNLRVCIDRCASCGSACAGAAWTSAGNGISSQSEERYDEPTEHDVCDAFISQDWTGDFLDEAKLLRGQMSSAVRTESR